MTLFEQWKAGKLEEVNRKKGLKSTVIPSCRAYSLFLSYRNDGKGYDESAELVAEACNISVRTVKRAISLVTK
jgi:hypothetical protein